MPAVVNKQVCIYVVFDLETTGFSIINDSIKKAERYGMKPYVITDATTAFVMKVIMYYQTDKDDTKKTLQVMKELYKANAGSNRTVYVDRLYTSLDLSNALDEMSL
jgi:hypothetical protein